MTRASGVDSRPARDAGAGVAARSSLRLLGWLGLLLLVLHQTINEIGTSAFLAIQALLLLALGLVYLNRNLPAGVWSPAGFYLIVVGLFHLGLAPYWMMGVTPDFPRPSDHLWFEGAVGATSLRLVSLGVVSYVVAVMLRHETRGRATVAAAGSPTDRAAASAYSRWGAGIVLFATLAWFAVVVEAGGVGLLVASYETFLGATVGTPLPYLYLLMGLGLGLAALDLSRPSSRAALAAFGLFAGFAFFLGLRGEVLFPAAVGATVVAMRRRFPGGLKTLAILVGGLMVIDVARQIRQTGLVGDLSEVAGSPLAALAELGATIRVVATVVTWHDELGEPFAGGATYTVFGARLLESLVGVAPPAELDPRLLNVEIANRAGNIGGSVVGEAYHNVGVAGVVVVFALLGWIFAEFSTTPVSAHRLAIYVCVAAPLFNHIRNSFVPVIPAIALGLVVVGACALSLRAPKPARSSHLRIQERTSREGGCHEGVGHGGSRLHRLEPRP